MRGTEARQMELEQEALQLGVERYREARERGEADLPPGKKLLKAFVGKTEAAIKAYMEQCEAGVPARSRGVYDFLQGYDLPTDLIAFVTCRVVIDGLCKDLQVATVALAVASTLEDTVNYDKLKTESPKAYRQLMRKIEKSSDQGYRHVVMRKQQKYAGIKTIKWGQGERLRLGTLLIELMQQATEAFEVEVRPEGKNRTPQYIVAKAATLEWIEKSHARCELMAPFYMPMIVRPAPWTGPKRGDGGYLTRRMHFPLVKGARASYIEELSHLQMPMVYAAVNALQDTAWRVNAPLFRVLREVWDGGGNLGKLPCRELEELPARSFTDEDATNQSPAFKAWKVAASKIYERNIRQRSRRMQMQQKLWVAERMSEFDEFHFVHALDFRGRTYAVASFVNPQGDDSAKALLEFAEGKPLGESGAFWLAVHGANNYGVDKVSFEDRVQWVDENHDRILESAMNPLDGTRWWAGADKPYQFLAFCFEWLALSLSVQSGTPQEEFVSRLPVGMDGACNGLQNFSAMLRDEVGGRATNLVPSDQPADIYAQVAAEASKIVDRDALDGNEVAARWAGRISRKLTKRNTMTVPYAVTEFGMRKQLVAEFRKMVADAGEAGEGIDPVIERAGIEDAAYLAKVNYEAIGKVVIAAREAMDWLKQVARIVAEDGLPVQWTSPSGFYIMQDYREMVGKRYDFDVAGRRYQMMLESTGDELNRRKQASGISPNFVHALDAAHMHRTIQNCVEAGVTSFAMIHDSYGTHAADVQTMAHILRASFVQQYTSDILGTFREQMVAQLPPKLAEQVPPVPAFGTLDLTAVMDSDYFFA